MRAPKNRVFHVTDSLSTVLAGGLIAAVSALAVAVVGAAIAARSNQRLEAEKERATQASAAFTSLYTGLMRFYSYGRLVASAESQEQAGTGSVSSWKEKMLDAETMVTVARIQLSAYGSDEVLAALLDWVKRGAGINDVESRRDVAKVMIGVRRDVARASGRYSRTEIGEDDVLRLIFRPDKPTSGDTENRGSPQ